MEILDLDRYYSIRKLSIRREATSPNAEMFKEIGRPGQQLVIGDSCLIGRFQTSEVLSIYVNSNTFWDKLVLPKCFPIEDIDLDELNKMEDNDILIATRNSIYLIKKLDTPNYY